MSLTLISADDPFEALAAEAEAAVRASYIADYLAAANAIDQAHIAYEIALYDEANTDGQPLMDEIRALRSIPAAA
jgi:hypothetical protein